MSTSKWFSFCLLMLLSSNGQYLACHNAGDGQRYTCYVYVVPGIHIFKCVPAERVCVLK